jgi:hypothetical protein
MRLASMQAAQLRLDIMKAVQLHPSSHVLCCTWGVLAVSAATGEPQEVCVATHRPYQTGVWIPVLEPCSCFPPVLSSQLNSWSGDAYSETRLVVVSITRVLCR